MNFGHTTKKIEAGIRYILDECLRIESVWGFGSYFRGDAFNDVDILAVLDCDSGELMALNRQIKALVLRLEQELGLTLDLLVLTAVEFSERPLRDMDQLVLLGCRQSLTATFPTAG